MRMIRKVMSTTRSKLSMIQMYNLFWVIKTMVMKTIRMTIYWFSKTSLIQWFGCVFQVEACAPAAFLTPWVSPSYLRTVVRATALLAWPPYVWRPGSTLRLFCSLPICWGPHPDLGLEPWPGSGWWGLGSAGPRWALAWGLLLEAQGEEAEEGEAPVQALLPRPRRWAAARRNTLTVPRSPWRRSERVDRQTHVQTRVLDRNGNTEIVMTALSHLLSWSTDGFPTLLLDSDSTHKNIYTFWQYSHNAAISLPQYSYCTHTALW